MEKHVVISDKLRAAAPDYQMIYLEADVVTSPSPTELINELNALEAKYKAEYQVPDINKRPGIAATRKAYKALGKDPNRYRPSQEQLMRRIVRGLGLYFIDNLVDTGNLLSLTFGSSIGVFDRDKIEGDTITVGVGEAGEPYEGIGRGPLNIEGLPVQRDAKGGIGTPTSDNERTKVTADTRRISMCVNIYGMESLPLSDMEALLTDRLTRYCSATNIESTLIGR